MMVGSTDCEFNMIKRIEKNRLATRCEMLALVALSLACGNDQLPLGADRCKKEARARGCLAPDAGETANVRDAALTGEVTDEVTNSSDDGKSSSESSNDGGEMTTPSTATETDVSEAAPGDVCDPVSERGCNGETSWCLGEGERGVDGGWVLEPRCVECEEDSHCLWPYAAKGGNAICEDYRCVACDIVSGRGCDVPTPACVRATNPGTQVTSDETELERSCVECSRDEHCPSGEASHCDLATNTCVGCNGVGQCAHIGETPACDVAQGRCVECTREESEACDGRVCHVLEGEPEYHTCSEYEAESTPQCGECVNDAQCAPGHRCVEEWTVNYRLLPTGKRYCMALEADLGDGKTCLDHRPFVGSFESVSEGGVEGVYCRPRQTLCPVFRWYGTAPDVIPEGEPGAGESTCLSDKSCQWDNYLYGSCGETPGGLKRCTYSCSVDDDCPKEPRPVPCVNYSCAVLDE